MYEFSRLPCLSGLYRASAGASSSELKILRCKIESEDLQGEGPGWGDRCWACGFRVAGSWLCVLGFRVKGIEAPVVPERDCSSLHKTSSEQTLKALGLGFTALPVHLVSTFMFARSVSHSVLTHLDAEQ